MPQFSTEQWIIGSLLCVAVASQVWDKRSIILGWWGNIASRPTVAPHSCQETTAHDCLSALRLLKHEAIESEYVDPDDFTDLIGHIDALAPMVLWCEDREPVK